MEDQAQETPHASDAWEEIGLKFEQLQKLIRNMDTEGPGMEGQP